MSNLNFNIPDSLHKQLKKKVLDQETTIKDTMLNLIEKYVGGKNE